MSDFLLNFRSRFTEKERESELYKILAMVGVNAEKSILEELNAEIRRSTEASAFSEDKIRSWLALFLSPVRNVVSASGLGRVVMDSVEGEYAGKPTAVVPGGVMIRASNGKEYQLMESLSLHLGSSTPFTFVQGKESEYTCTYGEFISIPIKSGMVDLSYTRVFLGEMEVPQVSPFPDYPNEVKDYAKNILGSFINKSGGVWGSVDLWNPLLRNMESLWLDTHAVSVRPRGGFFPFFFNNTLFIKIFPGYNHSIKSNIPDPNGNTVVVKYRISDGSFGNLRENQLEGFVYTIKTDTGGLPVKVSLYNNEAIGGVNPPNRAELINILRRRFYASSHVASIPEYTTWYLSQPGIGDCLVMSDFERWRLSGKANINNFHVLGTVDVYLVDKDGVPIDPKVVGKDAYTDEINELDLRMQDVRDVAFPKYYKPLVYWHYFKVQYKDAFSDDAFRELAALSVRNLYSLNWLRERNLSLFRALDTDLFSNTIRESYEVSGLRVIPYHYKEFFFDPDKLSGDGSFEFVIPHYSGEKAGGWYEFYAEKGVSSDKDYTPYEIDYSHPVALFKEFVEVSGICQIYAFNVGTVKGSDGGVLSWSWSSLRKVGVTPLMVGTREEGKESVTFVISSLDSSSGLPRLPRGVLRCFWLVANEGNIPVGNFINQASGYGIRSLPSDSSVALRKMELAEHGVKLDVNNGSSTGTFFGEFISFEKCVE